MLEPLHKGRGQVVELVSEVSDAQQHFSLTGHPADCHGEYSKTAYK